MSKPFWQYAVVLGMLLLVTAVVHAQGNETKLYVAVNGNDAWSGSLPEPNAAKSDGPLASLSAARDAIRKLRAAGKITGPVTVQVRGGTYAITEPVRFGPEDSGLENAPVVYEAFPGEYPVISGGRVITGWKQEGNLWTAEVPEARDGKWPFGSLWVNGARRVPARTPNAAHPNGDEPADSDTFCTEGPVVEKDPKTGADAKSNVKFRYRPDDLKKWDGLGDAIVVVYHSWETSELRVKNLDEANHIVEFTGPAAWFFGYWNNDQRYYVEQLFEALDQPGEWFLNHTSGKLYYIPMPGEDMAKVEVVAPVAKQLMVLEGNPAEGKFVQHMKFAGLRFHHTDYLIEPQGHSDGQAAASVEAAVQAIGARHCSVERCEVGHVANYGVWFRAGCQDNQLVRSEVFDLGAGAVRIGECGDPASENGAALRNTVDNCFLHDGGRIFRGAVGAWIGRSSHNTLSHCEICDFRYTGISVGWSWGYAPSSANHNTIEHNHIHHIGHGQLNDMGGIYTLGDSPGTVVRGNLFHDVLSYPRLYGGWGIYFDEGSTDILAENNIVYNTLTGGFHQHYGKENHVHNNIFAFSHGPQIVRSREEEHISFHFDGNIVYFNNGVLLGSAWKNDKFELDNNCYWDASGEDLRFAGNSLEEWRARGHDAHSIDADPMFVNAEAADFHLKPDSPALKLGFKPIDLSDAGLYGEPEWVNKPKEIPREPFVPPTRPAPKTIAEDFESTPVGNKANDAIANEEGSADIRVADETAASGKHSLKFTDGPGLKYAFNPHLVYSPHLGRGRVVETFAIRLEPGAILFHEWRDDHAPYRIGPSVWINANSELTVGGKTLVTVPRGQWIRIQIESTLGRDTDGLFTLTVTLPEQQPKRFEGLAFANPEFRRLDWLGFVSNATDTAVMYLDDLKLEIK